MQTDFLLVQVLMLDPVIAADGHTYERQALQAWLLHQTVSPVTGQKLKHLRFVSNQAAKAAITSHSSM